MTKPTKQLIAVDLVIRRGKKVLFITRKNDPFKDQAALPGGFVEPDETVEEAAVRELKEETGLTIDASQLFLVGIYSRPKRDPRGRVITVAFQVDLAGQRVKPKAGNDAATVVWLDPMKAPNQRFAFDHIEIVIDAENNVLASKIVPSDWLDGG